MMKPDMLPCHQHHKAQVSFADNQDLYVEDSATLFMIMSQYNRHSVMYIFHEFIRLSCYDCAGVKRGPLVCFPLFI